MELVITKVVTGGQGLAVMPDGKKIFVWNALPGERLEADIIADKSSYAEGIATRIIERSVDRIAPLESIYLSTSPWQILSESAESRYKLSILREQFEREHLDTNLLPKGITTDGQMYNYRNKVEFGFTRDGDKLSLAVTGRRSHEKIAVNGSKLARPELNLAADEILGLLNQLHVGVEHVSHLTLRCNQDGKVVGSLMVRTPRFVELPLPQSLSGLQVLFVSGFGRKHQTKVLQKIGDITLVDNLLGTSLRYGVMSFFQVNLPLYELALKDIAVAVSSHDVVELYAGVGSIGLTIGAQNITLVDIDRSNILYAKDNLRKSPTKGEVVHSSSEKALEYISDNRVLIVDPPRAGLSQQVISRIIEVKPPQVVYLSCDPATLARDLAKLLPLYEIKSVQAYNFFPRTPHIETLVILNKA